MYFLYFAITCQAVLKDFLKNYLYVKLLFQKQLLKQKNTFYKYQFLEICQK